MTKHTIIGLLLSLFLTVIFAIPWSATRAEQIQQCNTGSGSMTQTSVPSAIYRKLVAVNVYLPPCYAADRASAYPVIYLLHGGSADETQWPDLNVQRDADALIAGGAVPFVVVMPGAPYYESIDYTRFVTQELIPAIDAQFHVRADRSGRAIGGLSLGGYWALKLTLQHPDLFAAVGAYSPVVSRGLTDDPLPLAWRVDTHTLNGLNIALDVGDQDSLLYTTNQFAHVLRIRGIKLSLTSGHGGHDRPYWRARTSDYFGFFLKSFSQEF